MTNYSKNTLISFYSPLCGYDLIENLPLPNYFQLGSNKGYFFAYLLEGTFNTNKQIIFLNDLIARFYITLKANKIKKECVLEIEKPYKAKQLCQSDQLKSLQNIKEFHFKQNMDGKKDFIFWALKLFAIENIRMNGILNYQELENFGMNNFLPKKGRSDIRCKCRSIYNYYEKRDFEIEKQEYIKINKTKEEIKMTRKENLENYKKELETKNYKKVVTILTGLFANDFKKPNGGWNMTKLANETKLSRPTILKIVNKYKNLLK